LALAFGAFLALALALPPRPLPWLRLHDITSSVYFHESRRNAFGPCHNSSCVPRCHAHATLAAATTSTTKSAARSTCSGRAGTGIAKVDKSFARGFLLIFQVFRLARALDADIVVLLPLRVELTVLPSRRAARRKAHASFVAHTQLASLRPAHVLGVDEPHPLLVPHPPLRRAPLQASLVIRRHLHHIGHTAPSRHPQRPLTHCVRAPLPLRRPLFLSHLYPRALPLLLGPQTKPITVNIRTDKRLRLEKLLPP
jgi:hypothetical protein